MNVQTELRNIGERWLSFLGSLLFQGSLGISDLFFSLISLWPKYNDACGSEITKIERVFDCLELTENRRVPTNAQLGYAFFKKCLLDRKRHGFLH